MQKVFLPSSDGLYKVGYSKLQLVNAAHPGNPNKGECRSFDVHVWYPADDTAAAGPARYLANVNSRDLTLLNSEIGVENIERFLLREATSSFIDAEVSHLKEEFPVIVFCHDVGYIPGYYTVLMEHFASRGYFIFSIHHPTSSTNGFLWRAEDGIRNTVRGITRLIQAAVGVNEKRLQSATRVRRYVDYQQMLGTSYATLCHDWAEDTALLIEYIKSTNLELRGDTWNNHKFFASRLDLSRVVLAGHGFGAMVLQKVIGQDIVSSFVQLGGDQIPDSIFESPGKPMLTVTDASYVVEAQQNELNRCIGIDGLEHEAFTDIPFYRHVKGNFNLDDLLLSPRLAFNRITGLLDPFISQYTLAKTLTMNRAIL